MENRLIDIALTFLVLVAAVVIGFSVLIHGNLKLLTAATPGNLPATVASSSQMQIARRDDTFLFAASTVCASRIISTASTSIRLSIETATTTGGGPGHFGVASTTISNFVGLVQAASTTVVYPADEYGCPAMNAYSDEGALITIAETR